MEEVVKNLGIKEVVNDKTPSVISEDVKEITPAPNMNSINNSNTSGGIQPAQNTLKSLPTDEMKITLGRRETIANLEKSVVTMNGRMVMQTLNTSGEAGKGLSTVSEIALPAAAAIVGLAKSRLNAPMKNDLIRKYGTCDMSNRIFQINRTLQNNGYTAVKTGRGGAQMNIFAKRMYRKAKSMGAPKEILDLYKELMDIGTKTTFAGKNRIFRRSAIKSYSTLSRYLNQVEAGQGLSFTTNLMMRASQTLHKGIMVTRTIARLSRWALQKSALLAAKGALKAAKALGTETKVGRKLEKAHNKIHKANKKFNNFRKRKNDFQNSFRQFRRDPLHIKRGLGKLKGKIMNKLFNKFKTLEKFSKVLLKVSTVFAKIFGFVGSVFKYILLVGLAVVILMIIISIIVSLVNSALSMFNIKNTDTDIRQYAIEQLQTCYKEDLDYIQSLSSKYDNITISYNDVKNEDTYEKLKKNSDEDSTFYQSTNCAEILSMAYVRYDYELAKNTTKTELKNYVRTLYKASHTTTVYENSWTEKDSEGNEVTYTSANVVYTTYYFDYLFDCKYTSFSAPVFTDGSYTATNVQSTTWDYLISQGFTKKSAAAVMGNIMQESSFNPENSDGKAYGLLQWQDGRLNNLKKFAKDNNSEIKNPVTQLRFFVEQDAEPQFNKYTGREPYVYDNGELAWWPEKLTLLDYKNLKNIDTATEIFERVFERASSPRMEQRKAYAKEFYNRYKNRDKAMAQGESVATYACGYAGKLAYVWGGASLTTGADCSGFVTAVYAEFGISVPKGTQSLITTSCLYTVSYEEAMPGDIIVTSSSASATGRHTGIYIGNGKWVHASTDQAPITRDDVSKTQTRITNVPTGDIICVRRASFN